MLKVRPFSDTQISSNLSLKKTFTVGKQHRLDVALVNCLIAGESRT